MTTELEAINTMLSCIGQSPFGVSSYNQPKGYGVIWYLGSNESFRHPVALVKGGREYVDKWLEKYNILHNVVDIRNTRHIAWLKHIGFTFTDTVMINGYVFLKFYKCKPAERTFCRGHKRQRARLMQNVQDGAKAVACPFNAPPRSWQGAGASKRGVNKNV